MKKNKIIILIQKIKENIRFIKLYILTVIILFILLSLQPIIMSKFITNKNIIYIFLLFICLLSNEILDFYNNYILQKIRNYSKQIVWNDITSRNYTDFLKLNLGEVQNLVSESSFLVRNIFDISLVLIKNFLMLLVYFVFLSKINFLLGIVYIIFYISYIYISYYIVKNKSKAITNAIDSTTNINKYMVDYFLNYNTIYSENSFDYENKNMEELLTNEQKEYFKVQHSINSSNFVSKLILSTISLSILVYFSYNFKFEISLLLIIIYSIFNLMDFSKTILKFFEIIDRLNIIINKIELFDNKNTLENRCKFEYLDSDDILILNNICYKYPNTDKTILNNINISIKNGSINILKGENGKGKSTLAKIIALMLNPNSGQIIYNKKYINNKNDIIYYCQDTNLFNRTIIDNILYPNNKISDTLFDLIKKLELDNIIKNEFDLYNRKVGDFGKGLSGGEKQKILLIRAFLSDKKIIIFDEINSQIDKVNNEKFYQLINEYLHDRTVIIISHRENKINANMITI